MSPLGYPDEGIFHPLDLADACDEAADTIRDWPHTWTRGVFWRDACGIEACDPDKVQCACAVGHVGLALGVDPAEVEEALNEVDYVPDVISENDDHGRDAAYVALREAARLIREQEASR